MYERTLLLVDDEENILSALTRLLRRDGYKIIRASGGKEGLAMLAQHDVCVIISDQRMPEMTGVEFLSEVKEQFPNTVRMVLSGYTDLNSVTDAINRGAVYKFLTKPWDDELLRQHVEEAFQYHGLKRDNARLTRELHEANANLSKVNAGLQHEVIEVVDKAQSNLKVLQMEQEILDDLPIGVVGVDDFGMVVLVNRMAQQHLSDHGPLMIGSLAEEALPAELNQFLHKEPSVEGAIGTTELGDTLMQVFLSRLGKASDAKGTALVLVPVCGH